MESNQQMFEKLQQLGFNLKSNDSSLLNDLEFSEDQLQLLQSGLQGALEELKTRKEKTLRTQNT
jgi:hypothetical protein